MEFPPILVINLSHRQDRWKETQEAFEGWPPIQRLEAVRDSPGWKGCSKSHVKALQTAKQNSWPWVLVLEDDCNPTSNSLAQFKKLLPSLWEQRSTWDVFLGGCTSVKDVSVRQYDPPLLNVKGHTTHFCLYNDNSYDKLIEGILGSSIVIDGYFRETHSIRSICTAPHLATQRVSRSDIQDSDSDYNEIFKKSNQELLAASQQLEGFIQESKIFNNKLILSDILVLFTLGGLWLLTPA
jgi:glycosyl transferase family 25